MSEQQTANRTMMKLAGGAAALLAVVYVGFLVYSSVCPCERTPGGYLFGELSEQPVADWSFANSVDLCQLQIYDGIRPHSINLNCMATAEGEMYLSCSVCSTKYWASKVETDEPGVMRLDGVTYPVHLNRVTDAATMDLAWAARVAKLQVVGGSGNPPPATDAPRPDHWWTFRVTSRFTPEERS